MIRKKKQEKTATGNDRQFASLSGDIERLAVSTAKEFDAIRSEMATKSDIKAVLHAVENLDGHLSATAGQWGDEFRAVQRAMKDHEERLRLLENSKRQRLA